ncbi:MAG TPA: ATP-binding protein [bacterium]|nr:ATP-binding protein [bacterium]HPN31462.1 ATP-binding protein [bacterium]
MNSTSSNSIFNIAVFPDKKYAAYTKIIIKETVKNTNPLIDEVLLKNIIFCSDELLTNIIEHNKTISQCETIKIKLLIEKPNIGLEFEVRDDNPVEYGGYQPERFKRSFKGAGFYLISEIADEFNYYRENGVNRFKINFKIRQTDE